MSYIIDNKIDIEDGPRLSNFGNLRVVEDLTLFSSTMQNSDLSEDWDLTLAGSGSGTYNQIESSYSLQVTSAAGDLARRQTFRYFQYRPGNTTKVETSANLGGDETGVVKRVGLFDEFDGIYFQKKGSEFAVVVRSTLSSGNTNETVITQGNFNLDNLDGTGPSEITLDTTALNIYHIDFVWHGAGRIRFGILIGGDILYFHEIDNANNSALPYMGKGDLPLTYEIENLDGLSAGELKQFSNSIKVEGGETKRGFSTGVVTPADSFYTVPKTGADWYNLITIRIKTNNRRVSVSLLDVLVINVTDKAYQFAIIKNGDTSALTFTDTTDFVEEAVIQDEVISGGRIVTTGVGTTRGSVGLNLDQVRTRINSVEGGPNETFSLVVRRIVDSAEVAGSLNFVEFR